MLFYKKYCENRNIYLSCENSLLIIRLTSPPYSINNKISETSNSIVQSAKDKASLRDSKHYSINIYKTDIIYI